MSTAAQQPEGDDFMAIADAVGVTQTSTTLPAWDADLVDVDPTLPIGYVPTSCTTCGDRTEVKVGVERDTGQPITVPCTDCLDTAQPVVVHDTWVTGDHHAAWVECTGCRWLSGPHRNRSAAYDAGQRHLNQNRGQ